MGYAIAHDDIALLDSDIVDEQLPIALVHCDGNTEEGLVLLPVFEGSRIPDIPDDTVILQSVNDLRVSEGRKINPRCLKRVIGRGKASEFGSRIDDFGKVRLCNSFE